MMRRLTRYFPHLFKFLGKQNKSQRKTLLFEARYESNAQADLSLRHSHVLGTCTAQFDPDRTACVIKFSL